MQPWFDDPVTVGVASRFQPGAWHPSSIVFGASMGSLMSVWRLSSSSLNWPMLRGDPSGPGEE